MVGNIQIFIVILHLFYLLAWAFDHGYAAVETTPATIADATTGLPVDLPPE
jgi:hypothetical protein